MKRTAPLASLATLIAPALLAFATLSGAPAFAGGFEFSLPHLTFPVTPAPSISTSGCDGTDQPALCQTGN